MEMQYETCWLDVLLNYGNPTQMQKDGAYEYACENFMEIMKKDDFLQLDLDSLKTILKSDDLLVDTEDIVFDSVKRWLDFNKINPYDSLDSLLEVVRLPLVSPEFLLSDVLPYAYPITSCQNYVTEALRWHIFPNQRSKIPKGRTCPRRKIVNRLLALGSTAYDTSPIVELYDVNENKWTQLKKISITKKNFAAVLIESELLLIGGIEKSKAVNSVLSLNLNNGQVSTSSHLNDSRYNCWATTVKNNDSTDIYVAGGHGSNAIKGVEKWSSDNRQWTRMTPMNFARMCCGLAYLDGKLYAAGGRDGNKFYKTIEVCDLSVNTWQMKASMNQIRSYCILAASGKYLFAMGGHNGPHGKNTALNSFERYDPKIDVWTNMGSISSSGIVGLGVIGSNILICGGFESKIFQEYNVVTNRIRTLAPLIHPRDFVNIISLPITLSNIQFDW